MPKKKATQEEEIIEAEETQDEVENEETEAFGTYFDGEKAEPVGGDTETPEGTPGGEVEQPAKEEPPVEEEPQFTLEEEKAAEPKKAEDDGLTEIIHQGRVYKVTQAELVNGFQKSFDYDRKVGPHGKIAQMIDADPEFAKEVRNAWDRRMGQGPQEKQPQAPEFQISPLTEDKNAEDWLRENLVNFSKAQKPTVAQPLPQKPEDPRVSMLKALQVHDPKNYSLIVNNLEPFIADLPYKYHKQIDDAVRQGNTAPFLQMCDFVRDSVLKKQKATQTTGETQPITETPTQQATQGKPRNVPAFRVKSGGGEPERPSDTKDPWTHNNADFRALMNSVKEKQYQ